MGLEPVPEDGAPVSHGGGGGGGSGSAGAVVTHAKLSRSEDAIFTLKPAKDAAGKFAHILAPFKDAFDFVMDGLEVRPAREPPGEETQKKSHPQSTVKV